MELKAKIGHDKNTLLLFDTGEIICSIENGSVDLFRDLANLLDDYEALEE